MDYQIFPEGRRKAVTFGFDDGEIHDRRLAEMLRQYGLKATFFLVSGQMGLTVDPFFRYGRNTRVERVNGGELPLTYAGMEIASHTRFHRLSADSLAEAVGESMRELEELSGQPVTGLAYPGGQVDPDVVKGLREMGVLYARTTGYTHGFSLPEDLLTWNPTCKYDDSRMEELLKRFLEEEAEEPQLLYIMGHSYEMTQESPAADWNAFESICRRLYGRQDIWYAANGELARWIHTQQAK